MGLNDSAHAQFKEDIAYFNQVVEEVRRVSDRARAVLLGTELDRYLKKVLEIYFLPKTKKKAKLLEEGGPMGTFEARIEVAHRLGLIHPDWYHDLLIISEIRDKFAHGLAGMTLNQQPVCDLCFNLLGGKKWIEFKRKSDSNAVDNPQSRFVASGVMMLGHLCVIRSDIKQVPEIWRTYREESVFISQNPNSSQSV